MGLAGLTRSFPWYRYSKKLAVHIEKPLAAGYFDPENSEARGVHLALGSSGSTSDGNCLQLYLLVDKEDGTILDAKFSAFGQTLLIGAADALCHLCIGKNYDQAGRLTAEFIDKSLRDRADQEAFPQEASTHFKIALNALQKAIETCFHLPLPASPIVSPMPLGVLSTTDEGYPGWLLLPLREKIAVIERILDEEVRPYIALDAGDVHILNLIGDQTLIISYSGSCTSCYASIGSTLSYIQQIVRTKVHPGLSVIPDLQQ